MLAFLNNDLEVLEGSWLETLVRHAIGSGVGAVGAKLLYPDGFVQHAGVVIDAKGNPDHAYRLYPGDHPGPERRLVTTQRCLAVTGACMVMRREAFERAGGFDEEHLAVAFNDVVLCFKLRALGLENVWTPHACLFHHESYSRGPRAPTGSARGPRGGGALKTLALKRTHTERDAPTQPLRRPWPGDRGPRGATCSAEEIQQA